MANTFGGFAENPDGGRGPLAPAERQVQIEETLQMMMNTMRRMETSIQEELTNINVKIDNLSRQAAVKYGSPPTVLLEFANTCMRQQLAQPVYQGCKHSCHKQSRNPARQLGAHV